MKRYLAIGIRKILRIKDSAEGGDALYAVFFVMVSFILHGLLHFGQPPPCSRKLYILRPNST